MQPISETGKPSLLSLLPNRCALFPVLFFPLPPREGLSHNPVRERDSPRKFVKPPSEYRKYVYWLTPEEATLLVRNSDRCGVRISRAKGVVCTPLDERNRISIVAPSVWSETCARPGSWYRRSDRNGLYLAVSSSELQEFGHRKVALLTPAEFTPPEKPTPDEKEELIRDPDFRSLVPPEWDDVTELEKKLYLRWAGRLGSNVNEYAFLHLTQTANHANFLKPRFTVRIDADVVPYSIDVSAHVCSSCLELFQVLGREHARKLVVPCPGAVLFARLQPDRYLLVEKPTGGRR
jgi:hypothetical protein